jgi:hypothetical protein
VLQPPLQDGYVDSPTTTLQSEPCERNARGIVHGMSRGKSRPAGSRKHEEGRATCKHCHASSSLTVACPSPYLAISSKKYFI